MIPLHNLVSGYRNGDQRCPVSLCGSTSLFTGMLTVLFYCTSIYYLELASDKSTAIKKPFLGLEPCNTDMTLRLLFTFFNQENLGKFW